MRSKFSIFFNVDEDLLKDFDEYCLDNKTNRVEALLQFMKKSTGYKKPRTKLKGTIKPNAISGSSN